MSKEVEIEKTYLAKYLPENLKTCRYFEIIDMYLPISSIHPKLRIRKKGDKYTITKKTMPDPSNPSIQIEENINISKEEFNSFVNLEAKKLRKIRYIYPILDAICEIDIYCDDLKGLVVVDVEFDNEEALKKFSIPDFCLVDVSHEEFLAAGMLAGKKFTDIQHLLNQFNSPKIDISFLSLK